MGDWGSFTIENRFILYLMSPLLNLKIQSPEAVIWEGQARSLSSTNSQGDFDILPGHANMITLIDDKPLKVVDARGHLLEFRLKRGVIYVRNNFVSVYLL